MLRSGLRESRVRGSNPRPHDDDGLVSIGVDEVGDLTRITEPERIRNATTALMPDRTAGAVALFVGYWRRFLWDAVPGDLVVIPTRTRRVTIGEFVGACHYVAGASPRARHRRAVSSKAPDIDRDALGDNLRVTLSTQHSVQEFRQRDAADRLGALARDGRELAFGWPGKESSLTVWGASKVSARSVGQSVTLRPGRQPSGE